MVPYPLHKSTEASGLGLPLTPSVPGEIGCFLLAILPVSVPRPQEYTLTAPL